MKGVKFSMLILQKERQSEENLDDLFELDIRIFHPLSESEGSMIPTQHDATCMTSAEPFACVTTFICQ